jgi:hypothetical protein
MTLLRQNLLSLVPLFLILGILYAFISYELQTKELKWAVDQEALAIGHTIQSFAEHNADRYFEAIDGKLDVTKEFEIVIDRIIGQLRNESITVKNTTADTLYHVVTPIHQTDYPIWNDPEVLYESMFEGSTYSLTRHENSARLYITTEIQTIDGVFSISIVRDAQAYLTRINTLRKWIAVEVAISVVLGVIVSFLLTFFVRNRIKKLTLQSQSFLGGNVDLRLDQGSITEFNDLGSTLNILVNVFHKNMDWYRKSIQQKEQDRTSHNLAEFIKTRKSESTQLTLGKVHITADFAGPDVHPFFLAKVQTRTEPVLVWGTVNGQDTVETALLSEGVSQYLERLPAESSPLRNLMDTFGTQLKAAHLLYMHESGTIMHASIDSSGQETSSELAVEPGSVVWIHELSENVSEKIQTYSQHATTLPFVQLFSDSMKIVHLLGSTILIGVRRDL